MFMTKLAAVRFSAGWLLIAIQACATIEFNGSGHEPSRAQWARVEENLKRLNVESEKFDASHPLVGKLAGVAARELIADGYLCEVGYLDLPKRPKEDGLGVFVRTPLLFCEASSSIPGDFCVERHVVLDVAWPDINAGQSVLTTQMDEVVVTQRTFRCDTPAAVAIRLKHRQEGRQD
jgi:hypothetical protein